MSAKFESRELKDRSGWYVVATFPAALPIHIEGFETEAAAIEWIATRSAAWTARITAK
jgi:hypothetical protein